VRGGVADAAGVSGVMTTFSIALSVYSGLSGWCGSEEQATAGTGNGKGQYGDSSLRSE
jgi:hypothetical protein